jgi:hypothetical protein
MEKVLTQKSFKGIVVLFLDDKKGQSNLNHKNLHGKLGDALFMVKASLVT